MMRQLRKRVFYNCTCRLRVVTVQRNLLLCVLLEAGGCASLPDSSPPPDAFYIEQARATLLHLMSFDLVSRCEHRSVL